MSPWLEPDELRLGLGCMRIPEGALGTVVGAAVEAGIAVFDTARAYGNEAPLAAALRRAGAAGRARVVTKGGMARPAGAWVPDGRAKAIRDDCEASLAALDGLPVRQRAVLVLRFYEDLPETTVARVLHVPVGTVKSTCARALAELRRQLSEVQHDG